MTKALLLLDWEHPEQDLGRSSAPSSGSFNYALRFVQASRVSVFMNLTPVVGIAGAYVLLGERFTPGQAIAALVVGAGVWLANSGSRCAGPTCPPTA